MKYRVKLMRHTTAFIKIFRIILTGLGVVLFIALILSLTEYPYWGYYRLGTSNSELERSPDVLVQLGGGSMPSSDALMRSYVTAENARRYPNSKIIIAIPADTSKHEKSPEFQIACELTLRGVDSSRIAFETKGYNTRTQAENITEFYTKKQKDTLGILLITSPENMYRSVKVFEKLGIKNAGGAPAFDESVAESFLIKKHKKKSKRRQEILKLYWRYNIWNYLKYEILIVREYMAILYYKSKGWI